MSVYQWELHFDSLSLSPLSVVSAGWDETNPLAAVALFISFNDHSGALFNLTAQNYIFAHNYGLAPTYELVSSFRCFDTTFVDWILGTGVGLPGAFNFVAPNGNNGAEFLAGTSLFVTVDDGAGQISFTGALGVQTYSFATWGIATGALTSVRLARVRFLLGTVAGSVIHHYSLAFHDFYLSKDGTRIAGAQLGSLAAGFFSNAPWVLTTYGTGTVSLSNGHTTTRLLGALDWDPATNLAGIFDGRFDWDSAHVPQLADVAPVIALLCEKSSGTLIYARVTKQAVDAIEVGASFDSGHTWLTQMVGLSPGSMYEAPSLAESPDGSINLFAMEMGTPTTRWFRSASQGSTWDDFGVLLSILPWSTSSSPKVFTIRTGWFLVSYNHAGHWFLAVYEGGSVTSAGIQTTDMGVNPGATDTFPGMHEDALGNVYAVRAPSVLQEDIFRSEDLGIDWANVLSTPLGSKQVDTCSSPFSPLIWKLWQDGTGAILVAAATDFGSVYLFGAETAFAGAAQQYAAIAVLPKGNPIFVFQTYHSGTDTWSVDGFHSEDLGITWVAN